MRTTELTLAIKPVRGNLRKLLEAKLSPNEAVLSEIRMHLGEAIAVTDRRLLILKDGLVGTGNPFGWAIHSFPIEKLETIEHVERPLGGYIRVSGFAARDSSMSRKRDADLKPHVEKVSYQDDDLRPSIERLVGIAKSQRERGLLQSDVQ
jgi:hypothetical protein